MSKDTVPKDIRKEMPKETYILVERLRLADHQPVIHELDYFIPEHNFIWYCILFIGKKVKTTTMLIWLMIISIVLAFFGIV